MTGKAAGLTGAVPLGSRDAVDPMASEVPVADVNVFGASCSPLSWAFVSFPKIPSADYGLSGVPQPCPHGHQKL